MSWPEFSLSYPLQIQISVFPESFLGKVTGSANRKKEAAQAGTAGEVYESKDIPERPAVDVLADYNRMPGEVKKAPKKKDD